MMQGQRVELLRTGTAVRSRPVATPLPKASTAASRPFLRLTRLAAIPPPCNQFQSENPDSPKRDTLSALESLVATPEPPKPAAHASGASPASPPAPPVPDTKIEKTIFGLDALLGIEPKTETPAKGGKLGADFKESVSKKLEENAGSMNGTNVSVSEEAIDQLADMLSKGDPSKRDILKGNLTEEVKRATERARMKGGIDGKQPNAANPMMVMLDLNSLQLMNREELKKLKDAAFGPQTFWVTETTPIQDNSRLGMLIRGNLRDDRDKVFKHVCDKVQELFPGRFEVLMVEDDLADKDEFTPPSPVGSKTTGRSSGLVDRGPPVCFQIVPAAQAQPQPTDGIQVVAAIILSLIFFATTCELGLAANLTKLPKETLDWIADPANFDSDQLPPGLETLDPALLAATAIPVISTLLGVNAAHEFGHRIAAGIKNVKLGPTFFIPSLQIGSFGAITPFRSLLKDRATMWDVAAAGPLAGMAASLAVLMMGLSNSDPNQIPVDQLVPVPSALFQGSLLLGTITKAVLGPEALRSAEVLVSPLTIAGWYGMIISALQLMPVGCLDGGRMVQGAFGKNTLQLTAFFTYLGLGLGLLAGPISLPFGLYVLICQRSAERYIKDNVAPAGEVRQAVTLVAILAAVLILLPMAPELASAWGVGTSDPFR